MHKHTRLAHVSLIAGMHLWSIDSPNATCNLWHSGSIRTCRKEDQRTAAHVYHSGVRFVSGCLPSLNSWCWVTGRFQACLRNLLAGHGASHVCTARTSGFGSRCIEVGLVVLHALERRLEHGCAPRPRARGARKCQQTAD